MKSLRLALGLLACAVTWGQVGLLPMPHQQFLDQNGYPLAGGKLYTYAAGTTSPLASYTDATGTVANPNPVILDGGGFASIWISGTSKYKIVLQTSAGVTVWTADNISSTGGGYVAQATPGGGNQAVQFNGSNAFAGDPTFTYNSGTGTVGAQHFKGDGSCVTGTGYILASCYGVSAANADNIPTLNAVGALAFANGQASQSKIQLPCGTLKVNTMWTPPPLTRWYGCGRGDSSSLIPPSGNGTVIQATSAFAGYSFPNNAVVQMGSPAAQTFGVWFDGLTFDGNGYAGTGVLMDNLQEQSGWDHVEIENVTTYGVFQWGANMNSNSGTQNAGWNLPAAYQGDANTGPFNNTEIFFYGTGTVNSIPLVIANEAGLRGWKGLSIVTRGVTGNAANDATVPNVCAIITGATVSMSDVHCEGPRDGFVFGPWSIAPGYMGDGADHIEVDSIQYSSPSNGCTVHLQNVKGISINSVRGPAGSAVCDDNFAYKGDDHFYLEDINVSTNTRTAWGSRFGIHTDAPLVTSGGVNITGGGLFDSLQIESSVPCLTIQNAASTPFLYPYIRECLNANGDMIHTIVGVAPGNPQPLGDEYYQGTQSIAMGVGVNKAGLNFSAPGVGTANVMSLVGNALSWNGNNQNFLVAYNGHPDANAWVFGLDGAYFVGNNAATAGTYSAATVFGWASASLYNNGTQKFGNSGVSGGVTSFQNNAGTCTVNPTSTALSCTSDARRKQDIRNLQPVLTRMMQLRTVSFQWRPRDGAPVDRGRHVGLIAQEVEREFPDLVDTAADGYLELNYQGLIPYLVKSLQEEKKEIDELKREVRALQK